MNDVKAARENYWYWRDEKKKVMKLGVIFRYIPFAINMLVLIVAMVYEYINESNILIWLIAYLSVSMIEGVLSEKMIYRFMKEVFEMHDFFKALYDKLK